MAITVSNPNVVRDVHNRTYSTVNITWGHNGFPGVSVQGLAPLPSVLLSVAGGAQSFATIRGAIINNRLSHMPVILRCPDTGFEAYCPALSILKVSVITTAQSLYILAPGGTMLSDVTKVTLTDYPLEHSLSEPNDFPFFLPGLNLATWFTLGGSISMTISGNTNLVVSDTICDNLDISFNDFVATVAGNFVVNLRSFTGLNTIASYPFAFPIGTQTFVNLLQVRYPARIYGDGGLNLQYVLNAGTVTNGGLVVTGRLR